MARRVVVEILDSHGRVRSRERLMLDAANPRFTVGRGVAADVILDDAHVAALHAAVDITAEGRVLLTDLGSTNGMIVGNRRTRGMCELLLEDGGFGVGRTRLRVRTEAEVIAPEMPEDGEAGRAARNAPWLALAGALVCLLFVVYTSWVGAPLDVASVIATALISSVVLAGAWIAAWGFLTRVMQGEWRWMRHAAIFFSAFAAIIVIDSLLDILWFALALPSWPLREVILLVAAAAYALHRHLRGAAHISARRAALIALLLPLLIGGSSYLVVARNQSRDVNRIEIEAQLFPPSWRLRAGGTLGEYFVDASRLKEETDRKRRTMPGEDSEEQ